MEKASFCFSEFLYPPTVASKKVGYGSEKGANPSGFCPGIQLADQELLFGTICNLSLNSIFNSVSLFLTTILIRLIY